MFSIFWRVLVPYTTPCCCCCLCVCFCFFWADDDRDGDGVPRSQRFGIPAGGDPTVVDRLYGGGPRSHLAAAGGDAAFRADPPGLPRLILRLQAGATTSGVLTFWLKNKEKMTGYLMKKRLQTTTPDLRLTVQFRCFGERLNMYQVLVLIVWKHTACDVFCGGLCVFVFAGSCARRSVGSCFSYAACMYIRRSI